MASPLLRPVTGGGGNSKIFKMLLLVMIVSGCSFKQFHNVCNGMRTSVESSLVKTEDDLDSIFNKFSPHTASLPQ